MICLSLHDFVFCKTELICFANHDFALKCTIDRWHRLLHTTQVSKKNHDMQSSYMTFLITSLNFCWTDRGDFSKKKEKREREKKEKKGKWMFE